VNGEVGTNVDYTIRLAPLYAPEALDELPSPFEQARLDSVSRILR
jgi:hypothetical protein